MLYLISLVGIVEILNAFLTVLIGSAFNPHMSLQQHYLNTRAAFFLFLFTFFYFHRPSARSVYTTYDTVRRCHFIPYYIFFLSVPTAIIYCFRIS